MFEYIYQAFTVWFLGFFPFFEIYVAVPAGMALGLDPVSVVVFAVAGNFKPVLLIEYGYYRLMKYQRVRRWLIRPVSEKFYRNINQYGIWYILVITPWVGIWAVAVAARLLQMKRTLLIRGAFFSILVYAVGLVILITLGVDWFDR